MKRYRLKQHQRGAMNTMAIEALELRNDVARRLNNALMALSELDPGWMTWLENAIPSHVYQDWDVVRMIEARARALLLRRFSFFGYRSIGHLIFADWPFGDDGNLTPG